ncbi:MAG: sel1 repeat family protein [Muribaculaceae bacterium]|nr:sel1 repeat family protein [Muribaculaceae bacterium]
MRRIFIALLFAIGFVSNILAQYKLQFESFSEDTKTVEARRRGKLDQNGEPTAILKIQIPMLQDAVVSSPLKVGDEDYTPGELVVYLGDGSKRITVKHPDFESFEYDFPSPLKGKSTYKLILKLPEDYISAGEVSVKLNCNVLKATLCLENKETYHTENGQFLLRLKPGVYAYQLSSPLAGYQDLTGTLTITDDDLKNSGRVDEYLQMQSTKKSNLHITTVENSVVKIDGKVADKNKGVISLPLGRHYVEVESSGYKRSYPIDLIKDNEYLDADIRVPLTIVSPVKAEFSIKPTGDAVKPSVAKFKAGQKVRILGTYEVTAKAKGYPDKVFEVTAFPDNDEIRMSVPMISKARMLQNGIATKQDIKKAANEYQKLIAEGDDVAMWEYGKILMDSNGEARGSQLIKRAAEMGNPDAAVYCATKFCNGDADMMKSYLQKALDGGDKSAHQKLGDIYYVLLSVKGGKENAEKAFAEYALYNSSYSRIRRAKIALNNPDMVGIDPSDIIDLLKSIDKSDANYSFAQQVLGDMAYRGYGMKKNTQKAIEYWSNATPAHLTQDDLLIMSAYNMNNENFDRCLSLIDVDAIKKDYLVHEGISMITFLTTVGQKLDQQDVNQAFRFLKKAYDLGDRSAVTLSHLGKYYKDGKGVNKDAVQAKKYLKMAIDNHKHVPSMRWLGNIYENEKNYTLAEQYYKQAIAENDELAKGYYATLIYNQGKENYPLAEKLWTEAAEAGHKQSIRNLITYYEKVAKNPSKASYWKKKL